MSRGFDVLVGFGCLIPVIPILLVLAACIRVLDGRPVLFRQKRVGYAGTTFWLIKFRTMRPPAKSDPGFQAGSTMRVTGLGRLLRAAKLDELPQLINVIRGDMSIVGPRPEVPDWVERCPALFDPVLAVRPGITDPASLVFRHEQSLLEGCDDPEAYYRDQVLPAKLALSADYLRSRTLWSDLIVIGSTACAVVGLPHPWSDVDAGSLLQAECERRNASGGR